jgi:ribose 5-phosphate isomerase B
MKKITIALGADHRGFLLKEYVKTIVTTPSYHIEWRDVGAFSSERSDYPVFAVAAVDMLRQKKAEYCVLLCGTGVGMAMVANRWPGIYAAVVWNEDVARRAKEDDNANVVVLPADYVNEEKTRAMIVAWLEAEFKQGRYKTRISMIDTLTQQAQQ